MRAEERRRQRVALLKPLKPRLAMTGGAASVRDVRGGAFSCQLPIRDTIMQILTQLIFSGIALGMIYAVIAFGYQLTFATSDTLNFGQGDALMLGALVGLTLVTAGRQLLADDPDRVPVRRGAGRGRRAHRRAAGDQDQVGVRLDHVDHRAGHHLQERGRERLGPRRPASSRRRCPRRRSSSSAPTCCRWRSWWSCGARADDAGGRDVQPQDRSTARPWSRPSTTAMPPG